MSLGILHTALALGIVEESQDFIKWLFGVIQDVGKRSPLSIIEKPGACNTDGTRHR
jgi:hypothetical protein